MQKKKNKYATPVKTRHYVAISVFNLEGMVPGRVWEIHNRMLKKDKSSGKRLDVEKVIGRISFSEPDKYKCTEVDFQFDADLTKDEYMEILGAVAFIDDEEEAIFVRTRKDSLADNPALMEALTELEYEDDPLDDGFLLYEEKVTQWGILYMLLGMSLGMCLGISNHHQGIGMVIGMAVGFLLGNSMYQSGKKTREELKDARISGGEPPEEEE